MLQLSDLDPLIAQAEEDRRKAHAAADAEYAATVAAIQRIRLMLEKRSASGDTVSPTPADLLPPKPMLPNGHWPGLRGAIRQAVELKPKAFTLDDVVGFITSHYPQRNIKRIAVSSELWRMRKQGAIHVTEQGIGGDQNTYAKGGALNDREGE